MAETTVTLVKLWEDPTNRWRVEEVDGRVPQASNVFLSPDLNRCLDRMTITLRMSEAPTPEVQATAEPVAPSSSLERRRRLRTSPGN